MNISSSKFELFLCFIVGLLLLSVN